MFKKSNTFAKNFHLVFDDFLSDWESLRVHCDELNYDGVVNPDDGVLYPGINADIPEDIQNEIISNLITVFSDTINISRIFFRISTQGMDAPHFAHTDTVMNDYALMLYMNRTHDCQGGTAFLKHSETGLDSDPTTDAELETWQKDTNMPFAWNVVDKITMKPNRALIFKSSKMHGALPVGGFGDDAESGRLVLTCFFSLGSNDS